MLKDEEDPRVETFCLVPAKLVTLVLLFSDKQPHSNEPIHYQGVHCTPMPELIIILYGRLTDATLPVRKFSILY